MVQVLCPHSKDNSFGINVSLICNITSKECTFYRYCKELGKVTMGLYYLKNGCQLKNEYEKKDGEVDVIMGNSPRKKASNIKPVNETFSITCNVNYFDINKNKTSVSYTENGVTNSVFISGIYNGVVEIFHTEKIFNGTNILKIIQK